MIVPLRNEPRQELRIFLAGILWAITVWRQASDGYWYITVASNDGRELVTGARLTQFRDVMMASGFPGRLVAVNVREGETDPRTPDPWGNTHSLMYLP